MKNRCPLLLTVLIGLTALSAAAQPFCGFDEAHAKLMQENTQYRLNVGNTNSFIQTYIGQHPELLIRRNQRKTITGGHPQTLSAAYQIPVVVHVIHTGGDIGTIYNPTDAQILGAIDYLNRVYNGTWPGTATTGYGAGDLGIQFVLAQRDPNCNPTNGINRVDGSGVSGYTSGGVNRSTTLGTNELNIKNLSRWDNTKYYNIWVVDKIDGNDGTTGQFVAGYAYFPGSPANLDGIVMLATQLVAGQKTLPHEIGHAFNLYHPFEGSTSASQCPSATNCSNTGDLVCDTDPISENITGGVVDFTCRTGTNTCAGKLYTDATESNYMNYTNCYTLFTPGQSARMQAAAAGTYRSSLTTSLGGTAPDASCGFAKIDFQLQGDRQTETTAATTSCRSYKDYTYYMLIGGGSTATATATLTVTGGTATKGLDFDITTNGSFTSPSLALTFPAGSSASQAFTVRVYDDASVNGTRTATLGFTVDNGGGNATAGDGRPNFTLTIDDNDYAPTAGTASTGTKTIGSAQYSGSAAPFDASQQSQRAQFLYKASELTAAGVPAGPIRAIGFQVYTKKSIRSFTNLNIKMGMVPINYLYDNGTLTEGGGTMTLVKTLASYSTTAGINTFNLDAPFVWDGRSSIIVEICYDNGTASSTDFADVFIYYSDGGTANQANALLQNSVNCNQPFSGATLFSGSGIKPLAFFTYGLLPTTVQTAVNSTQSQYLGPNADIYFYDQTNSQLMARIQNLSSFDYGCTQLVIDRAGTNATQFWNSNAANYLMDKTFHVIPATNNPSGSYNITLYYTQAEVQGWQTATGQTLSAVQLVKAPGQISSVTPANPNGAGTVSIANPTISSLGTNTGLTYNFTNGFSGFGAGVPSLSPLAITLLDFSGRLRDHDALLSWSTSTEENSAGFEVDRSNDGQHFTKIGYVPAAGNSAVQKDYEFTDPALTKDSNYYQLKLISLGGEISYSKVILIHDPQAVPRFTVLPNPFTTDLDIVFGYVPAGPIECRLLDLTGRECWRQSASQSAGSRLHLGISGKTLSAGVYFLEVRSSAGIETQRVIKK